MSPVWKLAENRYRPSSVISIQQVSERPLRSAEASRAVSDPSGLTE